MADTDFAHEVTLWTDTAHAEVVTSLLAAVDDAVTVLGVGGPREAAVDRLARGLDRPRHDDLRKLLIDHPAPYLLLMTMVGLEPGDLATAAAQQTRVVTLEPVADDLAALSDLGWPVAGRAGAPASRPAIALLPAFLESPGLRRAAEPDQSLGRQRLISFHSFGRPEQGSLLARLLDSWLTVLHFAAMPESIDASLTGGGAVPDELREARGRLSVHGRMPDGSGAVLAVADRAGGTSRRLEAIGEEASLTATDTDYALRQPDGRIIDHHQQPTGPLDYVDLIADQWHRLMERPNRSNPANSEEATAQALACCQACLLSARTGQAENPRKLLEMHR